MKNTKHTFKYLGKTYEMTLEEIQAAYRYQLYLYRCEDAQNALSQKYDDDSPEYRMCIDGLYRIINIFEDDFDCNVDENTLWSNAIEKFVKEHSDQLIVYEHTQEEDEEEESYSLLF